MASGIGEKINKNYEDNFTAEDYYNDITATVGNSTEETAQSFAVLYEIVRSGKFKGNKFLDIGSGPTVHHVASASAYYSEIVLSDFVLSCRDELKKWLRGESQLDWSQFLNIVAQVEGYKNIDAGRKEIEARIRKSVKSVVRCDVLSEEIVPAEVQTEYDLILSAATLCAVAPDYEEYKKMVKRISRLLRHGGGLILMGLFNDVDEWGIKGNKFHTLPLNQQQVDGALEQSGFISREWSVLPKPPNAYWKYDNMYIVVATKL